MVQQLRRDIDHQCSGKLQQLRHYKGVSVVVLRRPILRKLPREGYLLLLLFSIASNLDEGYDTI